MKEQEQLRRRARTALLHAVLCLDDPYYGTPEEALAHAITAIMHMKNIPGVADRAYDLVKRFAEQRKKEIGLKSLDHSASD